MSTISIAARWIVPVSQPPIENGRVVIADGVIVRVERAEAAEPADVDYGDAVIVPGFINTHTHLELSGFRGRAPFAGSFIGWIGAVVGLQASEGADEQMRAAVGQGLRESLAAGVTTVVDIGRDECVEQWRQSHGRVIGLLEVLGVGPRAGEDHSRSIQRARGVLDKASGVALGISPHAPYSTGPQVFREAIELATRHKLPISTHLAETREELEFTAHGAGPFRQLLEVIGVWDGSFEVPSCSPVAYAERLGLLACRPILAHLNYVSDADVALLAQHDCSVAYCPRTHEFFQHEPHRYGDMLAAGVNVCVGTDSLASNETLSILDELRFLRAQDARLSSEQLLELGTIHGAKALDLESQIGSIEPGKRADLAIVGMSDEDARSPVDDILRGEGAVQAVYVGGSSFSLCQSRVL